VILPYTASDMIRAMHLDHGLALGTKMSNQNTF
jgi:hypothetical protein